MSKLRKMAVAGASAVAVVAALTTASPAMAQGQRLQADYDCPSGSDPSKFPGTARTVKTNTSGGRTYELRYNSTVRCAWGRVIHGVPGDGIWVDWSRDGGRNRVQLGGTHIEEGSTKFTNAYNDAGFVMRACGKPSTPGYPLVCTDWF